MANAIPSAVSSLNTEFSEVALEGQRARSRTLVSRPESSQLAMHTQPSAPTQFEVLTGSDPFAHAVRQSAHVASLAAQYAKVAAGKNEYVDGYDSLMIHAPPGSTTHWRANK